MARYPLPALPLPLREAGPRGLCPEHVLRGCPLPGLILPSSGVVCTWKCQLSVCVCLGGGVVVVVRGWAQGLPCKVLQVGGAWKPANLSERCRQLDRFLWWVL